jgi:hypothetical protein
MVPEEDEGGLVSRRNRAPLVLGVLVLLLGEASGAAACTTCYGQAGGPLIDAARLGIWLLLGVTLVVQGGFVAFFIYLRRRAALCAEQTRGTLSAVAAAGQAAEGIHG